MIKYRLKCNCCSKSFDSWFSSSKEYDKLKKKQYLNCLFCNSRDIKKTLMAPNVLGLKYIEREKIKIKKLKTKFWDFKTILKIILKMLETILYIKLGICIITIKKKLRESMEMQQKNKLLNYMKRVSRPRYFHG